MEREEVTQTVIKFINNTLEEPVEISLSDRLIEDVGMDSIGFVQLTNSLEENYEIDIDDSDLKELITVNQVIDFVLNCEVYDSAS